MKNRKPSGSSDAVTNMSKAGGEPNLKSITSTFNEILLDNKVPEN